MKLTQLTEQKERLYVCVHAKTPKHEVYAKSSYDAAKQAAEYWGMKSTAGIDAHLVEGNYPEPRKMQVTQADKDNNTEAWKRFRAGDPRYEWKSPIDKDDKLASLRVIDPNNRRHDDSLNEYSDKQIKMAFGVLNDPRFKGGDFDGAVEVIEKIAKGLSDHPSVANALRRANESVEKINEIDPSRSPWTQSGKHPGAMNQRELEREIAVFDELRDRGDYLSPRELAQEDSLYHYLENASQQSVGEMAAEDMRKQANHIVEKAKWIAERSNKYV